MRNRKRLWLILLAGILLGALGAAAPAAAPAAVEAALAGDLQAAGALAPAVEWSGFKYIFVAGTTLRPRSSGTAWTYGGGGCVHSSSTSTLYNIHLDIPHGSRIDYVRLYYYDTSAANGESWLTTYNGAGAFTDLIKVDSSGAGGYGYTVSNYIGHVADTSARGYVLRPNQTGSAMRLCGLRVAYRTVEERVYLPLIRR